MFLNNKNIMLCRKCVTGRIFISAILVHKIGVLTVPYSSPESILISSLEKPKLFYPVDLLRNIIFSVYPLPAEYRADP